MSERIFIYKIIPHIEDVEDHNGGGRWFSERKRCYIHDIFKDNKISYYIIDGDNDLYSFIGKNNNDKLISISNKFFHFSLVKSADVDNFRVIQKLGDVIKYCIDAGRFDLVTKLNDLILELDNDK
jgi:hypothetical protein